MGKIKKMMFIAENRKGAIDRVAERTENDLLKSKWEIKRVDRKRYVAVRKFSVLAILLNRNVYRTFG